MDGTEYLVASQEGSRWGRSRKDTLETFRNLKGETEWISSDRIKIKALSEQLSFSWTLCVPSLESTRWNPNPQGDGGRRWGLWEIMQVMRVESSQMGPVPL